MLNSQRDPEVTTILCFLLLERNRKPGIVRAGHPLLDFDNLRLVLGTASHYVSKAALPCRALQGQALPSTGSPSHRSRGRENHLWPQDFCIHEKQPQKEGLTAGTTVVSLKGEPTALGMLTAWSTQVSIAQQHLGITATDHSCLLSIHFRKQTEGLKSVPTSRLIF